MVIVGACGNKRDVIPLNADVTSYHKLRPWNFIFDQSFIDKMMGQQTLLDVPDQAISQQGLHDTLLKEQSAYPSGFPISRRQPFKQNLFRTVTAFGDESLFRETLLKDHELRGERAVFRNSPFEEQNAPFASEEIFGGQAPFVRQQLLTPETPLKNLFHHGQSSPGEQAPFQKQTTHDNFPAVSDLIKFHPDDSYNKPIDSYGRQRNVQATSYGGHTMYTGLWMLRDLGKIQITHVWL